MFQTKIVWLEVGHKRPLICPWMVLWRSPSIF